jgi:hypothetical protein
VPYVASVVSRRTARLDFDSSGNLNSIRRSEHPQRVVSSQQLQALNGLRPDIPLARRNRSAQTNQRSSIRYAHAGFSRAISGRDEDRHGESTALEVSAAHRTN